MTLVTVGALSARLVLAFLLGIAVGAERQLRARAAGLRTTTPISVGSALFTILGAEAFGRGDPTRVAAQVVSGVGFLGAGVIIKHGGSISGLNTAATMWASAAIGTLCGAGLWEMGVVGSICIVLANSLLRTLSRSLAKTVSSTPESGEVDYAISTTCLQSAKTQVRALLFEAVNTSKLTVMSFSARDSEDIDEVAMRVTVHAFERNDSALEETLKTVVGHPAVTDISWSVSYL
ncbi:hypothetical protein B1R42_02950 [Trueperella pyogenes]|uniref:MgtC/SapB family protein n=1 Tax=Trueperella pyogenes TaxID=1661 RepID=UPI0009B1EDE9|nr:MgtC/SapB family protein [Trueperella pyogenes]AWA42903.1 MgtC/SapB family protein [Trueperella pyogenes]OQD39258.1 hypothetical protein B1R42_02950 [Trueperella pyogenes]